MYRGHSGGEMEQPHPYGMGPRSEEESRRVFGEMENPGGGRPMPGSMRESRITYEQGPQSCLPVSGGAPPSVFPQRPGEPDCRDYLRTGRCKYGDSCKYHHPPGVQSGGGTKKPLNPNEPVFPIRPNEPSCQYYLKHGTCKFGQSCKFHHPPHVLASGGGPSGAVLMNMAGGKGLGGQQLYAIDGSGAVGDLQQVVQLLPQRPGEPDCIYFLRNGRCKYGATCKYHHPLTNNTTQSHPQSHLQSHHLTHDMIYSERVPSGRSPTQNGYSMDGDGRAYVQASYGGGQGGSILLSDSNYRVMTFNQGGGARSYSNQTSSNGNSPVITSTSVSSYETAGSTIDFMQAQQQGSHGYHEDVAIDSSGRVWRRTNSQESFMGHRQPSQESLSRRNVSQEMIPRELSAENGQSLSRQGSHGSFSAARMGASPSHEVQPSLRRGGEFPAYADGFSSRQDDRSWSSSSAQSSRGSYPQSEYVVRRSSSGSYLNTGAPEFVVGEDQNRKHDSAVKQLRGNAANGGGHSAEDGEEEGLSMLTSALLNMLDTTDHDASGRDKRGDRPPSRSRISPPDRSSSDKRIRSYQNVSSMPAHQEVPEPPVYLSGSESDEDGGPPTPRAGVNSRGQTWDYGLPQHSNDMKHYSHLGSMLDQPNHREPSSTQPQHPPGWFYLPSN